MHHYLNRLFKRRVGLSLFTIVVTAAVVTTARAQCVDSSVVNGYKVRSIRLETLFGRVPEKLRQSLKTHSGDSYSADRAIVYIQEVRAFYGSDPAQEKYERLIANKLKLSVKAGTTNLECVAPVDAAECQTEFPGNANCVDVTLKRYFIEVDALDASPYVVLFPRSALVALYGAMPRPLLALNPAFNAFGDRRLGPAVSIDTATDLLDLKQILAKESRGVAVIPAATSSPAPTPSPSADSELEVTTTGGTTASGDAEPSVILPGKQTELLLRLRGSKSLTKSFYETNGGLSLTHRNDQSRLQKLQLEAGFTANELPQGNGTYLTNQASLIFNTDIRPKKAFIKLFSVAGGYHWSRNRLTPDDVLLPPERLTENGFDGRLIADGILGKGLVRAGFWFDGAGLSQGRGSYQRAAALIGYAKDFVIPRKKDFHKITPPELNKTCWTALPDLKQSTDPNKEPPPRKNEQMVSLEMTVGAGRSWGNSPEYARFYAGGAPGQFLYDELDARSVTAFPRGPILRSQPVSQAGVPVANLSLAATSFWHVNVNIGVPVSRWSSPLIPYEWVTASAKKPKPPAKDVDGRPIVDRRLIEDKEADGHVPDGALICRDLKSVIKTLVGTSGANLLVSQQARDMLTSDQKDALRLANAGPLTPQQADRLRQATEKFQEFKDRVRPVVEKMFDQEILPITNFIADHANVIAVKPMFMFDIANNGLQGIDSQTRFGLGGGMQIDVVIARFELGYMAALNRLPGDSRGSFVGRLILRRLF
jgi:hypothetical protein